MRWGWGGGGGVVLLSFPVHSARPGFQPSLSLLKRYTLSAYDREGMGRERGEMGEGVLTFYMPYMQTLQVCAPPPSFHNIAVVNHDCHFPQGEGHW